MNDKIYKKTFDENGVLVNFSIPKFKFCKIAQLLIVSVLLVRGFLEGTREYILHIFRALVERPNWSVNWPVKKKPGKYVRSEPFINDVSNLSDL